MTSLLRATKLSVGIACSLYSFFDDVRCVIANEEKFKLKLGIGRDAFVSLKAAGVVGKLWDVGGAAGTGVTVASSGAVASTFFGSFWTGIGLATAATPIGWVIGAAVVSGGAYYGVSRLFRSYAGSRVDEVPRFINTGLDVLATSAMDLLGSLALKVALIDGTFDETERSAMVDYFVEEWGYDTDYVDHAVDVLEQNIGMSRLSDMAAELARFASDNPNCDYASIQKEILALLNEIAEADGNLDEREEMAIQKVEEAFRAGNSLLSSAGNVIGSTASGVVAGVGVVGKSAESTFSSAKSTIGTLSGKLWSKK